MLAAGSHSRYISAKSCTTGMAMVWTLQAARICIAGAVPGCSQHTLTAAFHSIFSQILEHSERLDWAQYLGCAITSKREQECCPKRCRRHIQHEAPQLAGCNIKLCCCFASDAPLPDIHSFPMSQCQGLPDPAFPSRGGEEQRALHEGCGILQHILLMLNLDCEGLVGVTLQRHEGHLCALKADKMC